MVRLLVNFLFSASMNRRTRGAQAEEDHRGRVAAGKGYFCACRKDFKGEQMCASKGGRIYLARIWRRMTGLCLGFGS